MAKSIFTLVSLILSAFCFSSVLGTTQNAEQFFVEGKIYCDPCRLEFETKLSHSLSGVKVSLECKKPDDDSLTFSNEGFTDNNGIYSIPVEGDHEDEVCMLKTVTSTHPECNELMSSTKSFDRIVLTNNMGVTSMARYVNPLGFMTKNVDSRCADIVKELEINNQDN